MTTKDSGSRVGRGRYLTLGKAREDDRRLELITIPSLRGQNEHTGIAPKEIKRLDAKTYQDISKHTLPVSSQTKTTSPCLVGSGLARSPVCVHTWVG
jgi:hypothetical protein